VTGHSDTRKFLNPVSTGTNRDLSEYPLILLHEKKPSKLKVLGSNPSGVATFSDKRRLAFRQDPGRGARSADMAAARRALIRKLRTTPLNNMARFMADRLCDAMKGYIEIPCHSTALAVLADLEAFERAWAASDHGQ
jgi:hypothetical protein